MRRVAHWVESEERVTTRVSQPAVAEAVAWMDRLPEIDQEVSVAPGANCLVGKWKSESSTPRLLWTAMGAKDTLTPAFQEKAPVVFTGEPPARTVPATDPVPLMRTGWNQSRVSEDFRRLCWTSTPAMERMVEVSNPRSKEASCVAVFAWASPR